MTNQTETGAADWKTWFQAPQIMMYSRAKHNPNVILAASTQSGTLQWYQHNLYDPAVEPVQLTDTQGGHTNFIYLSADGRFAYTLDDSMGNEIGHFVRIDLQSADRAYEDIAPDLPLYSSFDINPAGTCGKIGFVATYNNTFYLYVFDVAADGTLSNRKEVAQSKATIGGIQFSADGKTVFYMTNELTGTPATSLRACDIASGKQIGELWDGEGSNVRGWHTSPVKGDGRIVATTNRSGVETLVLWNPHTGEREDLQFDNMSGAAFPDDWSHDGQKLLIGCMDQAAKQMYVYDLASKTLTQLGIQPGTYFGSKFKQDGDRVITMWQDATHPNSLVELDSGSGELLQALLTAGEIPQGRPWRSIAFQSANGQMIQGWLGVPEGEGPFPTILETHGGPTAVKTNTFSAAAQTWMEKGFAFLSINYQGSVTFGRDFQNSIYGRLGELEVEDMVAARQWLIDNGISHPDQIFPSGGSYGGYLTLMALGKEPDLWAGGLAFVAVADWVIQYEDTAETLRAYQVSLLGGTPDEVPEVYAKSSPITYAEHVNAPVLILQGKNDTRTPARPVAMYAEKLEALGKQIELHWFETGHAGSRADISKAIEHMELQLDFVDRVLGQA